MAKSFDRYRMPDELWIRMESLLPDRPRSRKGGRPRLQKLKPVADAIFYKMRTGCQWNALPRVFGASSTIHDYFQEWVELGIFERIWNLALTEYEELRGTSWKHQSLDTATVKAPLGGKKTGRNPTDRGKRRALLLYYIFRPARCCCCNNCNGQRAIQKIRASTLLSTVN